MAERPILAMPKPESHKPQSGPRPRESILPAELGRQVSRLGPKFERLERTLSDPKALVELRDDPAAIVPERALVFEIASEVLDFYRAIRRVHGLEFLGEDEGEVAPDEDFYIRDKEGKPHSDKGVLRRFYFTIPDQVALKQLANLWRRYEQGADFGHGWMAWKKVFEHLADIRPWGPKDRLTEEAAKEWEERLRVSPSKSIRFEVEFWYRDDPVQREKVENELRRQIEDLGGRVIDRALIDPIRYHAALLEGPPNVIRTALGQAGLVLSDTIMVIRPQSLVSAPVEGEPERILSTAAKDLRPPMAALFDGLPMAQHERLSGRLIIDDPDDFEDRYKVAEDQRHGTAMASLIIHGDLNKPDPEPPVQRQLYVRPVMYPQQIDFDGRNRELMPPDRLVIDLIWQAFLRMYDGEDGNEPTAPTVRIVNLSLGDANRRFSGVMSPWARLIDHLAWLYRILIFVSAGNIKGEISLDTTTSWADFEGIPDKDRQSIILGALLRLRAERSLLSPSESINSLTIGAAHDDYVIPKGQIPFSIDPYASRYLPNPSSAMGLGFRRSVKPEIMFPGGKELVYAKKIGSIESDAEAIKISPMENPAQYFGIGTASPGLPGRVDQKINMSGTSVATALATHAALRITDAFDELPNDPVYPQIDSDYYAVILKALLLHSARWDRETVDALKSVVNDGGNVNWAHEREEMSRFLGFGYPDISRVIDCAENRATLVGWNTILGKTTDRYRIPLPAELEGMVGYRAVSVTIGWLAPITLSHRMYRLAKFNVTSGGNKLFSLGVENSKRQPSHYAVGRGTVYHRRWEGESAADFVDDGHLLLDVTCLPTAGDLDEPIPYAVVVTLEVGVDIAVPIYERIRERLREAVRLMP